MMNYGRILKNLFKIKKIVDQNVTIKRRGSGLVGVGGCIATPPDVGELGTITATEEGAMARAE
jgi:hypothetical protein